MLFQQLTTETQRVSVHYRHLQIRRQCKSSKEPQRQRVSVHYRYLQLRRQCKSSKEQQIHKELMSSIDICNSGVNVILAMNSRDTKS